MGRVDLADATWAVISDGPHSQHKEEKLSDTYIHGKNKDIITGRILRKFEGEEGYGNIGSGLAREMPCLRFRVFTVLFKTGRREQRIGGKLFPIRHHSVI